MRNIVTAAGVIVVLVLSQGCASMLAYQHNERQADARAISAAAVAGGGAGVGVDVLKLRGWTGREIALQAGAAVVDAAGIYGLYQLYDRANSSEDNDTTYNAGRDIRVNSPGRSVNDSDSNNTENAPSEPTE